MTLFLLGYEGADSTDVPSNTVKYCQSTSVRAGLATKYRVWSNASGNAKIALYDDSSDQPNNRLSAQQVISCSASQWNDGNLVTPVSIADATKYWLGINSDTFGVCCRNTGTQNVYNISDATYSTWTFPDPANLDSATLQTTNIYKLALYGSGGARLFSMGVGF